MILSPTYRKIPILLFIKISPRRLAKARDAIQAGYTAIQAAGGCRRPSRVGGQCHGAHRAIGEPRRSGPRGGKSAPTTLRQPRSQSPATDASRARSISCARAAASGPPGVSRACRFEAKRSPPRGPSTPNELGAGGPAPPGRRASIKRASGLKALARSAARCSRGFGGFRCCCEQPACAQIRRRRRLPPRM